MGYFGQGGENDNELASDNSLWPKTLPLIDLPDSTIRPEVKSVEREIQIQREQTTLAVLVFKNSKYLPESPTEPNDSAEASSNLEIKTKLIPLEDTNEQFSSAQQTAGASAQEPSLSTKTSTASETGGPESPKFYKPAIANSGLSKYHPQILTTTPEKVLDSNKTTPMPNPNPNPNPNSISTKQTDNIATILNISKEILPTAETAEKLKQLLETILVKKPTSTTSAVLPTSNVVEKSKSEVQDSDLKRDAPENMINPTNRSYNRANNHSESNQRWQHSG